MSRSEEPFQQTGSFEPALCGCTNFSLPAAGIPANQHFPLDLHGIHAGKPALRRAKPQDDMATGKARTGMFAVWIMVRGSLEPIIQLAMRCDRRPRP